MNQIPIVVGVTGHRDIRSQDHHQLKQIVEKELMKLKEQYPASPFVMLNSLAEGADQLCAEVALRLGFKLVVPLPKPLDDYQKDFTGASLEQLNHLCSQVSDIFVVSDIEGLKGDSSYSYRQAGLYISIHCQLLLALWDETLPVVGGCGAAETVEFMMNGSYIPAEGLMFHATGGAVLKIITPRVKNAILVNAFAVSLLDNGNVHQILKKIDTFNREADQSISSPLVPEEIFNRLDPQMQTLHRLYLKADALSVFYRDRYLKAMKWLSIIGVLLVLTFLLYDELNSVAMLLLYGVLLLISSYTLKKAKKATWHERYLDYRVLAESLRVQFFIGLSGCQYSVYDAFTWSQQSEVFWVQKAMGGLLALTTCVQTINQQEVRLHWIDHQLEYHRNKQAEKGKSVILNEKIASSVLFWTVILYLLIAGILLYYPLALEFQVQMPVVSSLLLTGSAKAITIKGISLILLGVLSSISVFLSNYYGKLSLERKASDHQKMVALYQQALEKWNMPEVSYERVARELAREEIIENGVWLSYSRHNSY